MIRAYLDTSIVAAYFTADPLSDCVADALTQEAGMWWVSNLVATELASVLARRAREKLLTVQDSRQRLAIFERMQANGEFRSHPFDPVLWQSAADLLLDAQTSLRTLDALHLAIAFDLYQGGRLDTIWTGDRRLAQAAEEASLPCRLFTA